VSLNVMLVAQSNLIIRHAINISPEEPFVITHVFSAPFYSELFSLLLSNFISLSFSHFLKEHELWFHSISSGCNRLLIFEI